jgi:predicted small secreted protein
MKTNKLNWLLLTLFTMALLLGITGCKHTAHGAGEDIEQMGEKIQEKTR